MGISLGSAAVLLTKEDNPMEGCRAVWAIHRGLQVLCGGHTESITLEDQHRISESLNTRIPEF